MRILVAVATICAATLLSVYQINTVSAQSNAGNKKAPLKEVAIQKVKSVSVDIKETFPGRVTAFRQAEIRPQVEGIVIRRMFEEGSEVQKGQQLYQIDDTRYAALLHSAEADLEAAQAEYESIKVTERRFQELLQMKAVSQQEYDDLHADLRKAKAEVAVAKAAVDIAKINVGYTKVYAPISGRISRSAITEGALVTGNQSAALATITQLDPIYVDIQHTGKTSDLVHLNSLMQSENIAVQLLFDEQSNQVYQHEGVLKLSEVTVDRTTGSVALRAEVPNPERYLLPGMYVRTSFNAGNTQAVLVPQSATQRGPNGKLQVWLVGENNIVEKREVVAESTRGSAWVVTEGLKTGDMLITEGYQKVRPGEQVSTVMGHVASAQAAAQ
ncbi:efflux RND transporter periplasmic adaptor subunit [Sessilibacter sp. MAH4]